MFNENRVVFIFWGSTSLFQENVSNSNYASLIYINDLNFFSSIFYGHLLYISSKIFIERNAFEYGSFLKLIIFLYINLGLFFSGVSIVVNGFDPFAGNTNHLMFIEDNICVLNNSFYIG